MWDEYNYYRGFEQDVYDDKRAKEFKKIIQLPTKEFIAEYLAKLLRLRVMSVVASLNNCTA